MNAQIDARIQRRSDPLYLRQLLENAGISQREAARRAGVPYPRFRRYLYSTDHPSHQPAPYSVQVVIEAMTANAQAQVRAGRSDEGAEA